MEFQAISVGIRNQSKGRHTLHIAPSDQFDCTIVQAFKSDQCIGICINRHRLPERILILYDLSKLSDVILCVHHFILKQRKPYLQSIYILIIRCNCTDISTDSRMVCKVNQQSAQKRRKCFWTIFPQLCANCYQIVLIDIVQKHRFFDDVRIQWLENRRLRCRFLPRISQQ